MSTLTELIDDVEAELKDTGNARWSSAELEHHVRRALRAYSRVDPQRSAALISSLADTREYNLATPCPGLLELLDVWFPYDDSAPQYPPNRPAWSMLVANTLRLEVDGVSGDVADKIRVFYTHPHTIQGLDGAASTSLSPEGEQMVILAASAHAAMQYAQSLMGTVTPSGWTPRQFQDWAHERQRQVERLMEALRQRLANAQDARAAMAGEV